MRDEIRKIITSSYHAYLESSGWVHPSEVGARIETDEGSHMWQVPHNAEKRALESVFNDLMQKWSINKPSFELELAINNFLRKPSLDGLVWMAERLYNEFTNIKLKNISLQCNVCGYKKEFNQEVLKTISLKLSIKISDIDRKTLSTHLDKFKCSKCGEKDCCLLNE